MSEINNNNMPSNMPLQPMQPVQPQAPQPAVQPEQAAAPQPVVPADQAMAAQGMAQLNMGPVQTQPADTIQTDVAAAIKNPAILNQSEILFDQALKAGYSYPEAATFATQEVR